MVDDELASWTEPVRDDDSMVLPTSYELVQNEPTASLKDIDYWTAPSPLLSRPLSNISALEIALEPSFQVTTREYRAVNHFQTQFSLSRTSKSPSWSTHSLILRLGLGNSMVMHLIIASALYDLLLSANDQHLSGLAAKHYHTGAQLLINAINDGGQSQSNVLSSFFLLYVCMSLREDPIATASRVSLMLTRYIQTNDLDGQSSNAVDTVTSDGERSYTARLIIWLVYEDIGMAFKGSCGALAAYARGQPARMEAIYEQSSTIFESCWGTLYPDSEAVDDVENSTVLRFLFDVMCIMQDINHLKPTDQVSDIEQRMNALQSKSRPLIRLTTIKDSYASRLLVNVDWSVALFFSLRLYLFRVTDGVNPSTKTQDALTSLLLIAQRRLSSGKDEMYRRFEMPLFMAGIETTDPIHREWILSKLTIGRYRRAMKAVLQLQKDWGVRAPWSTVRDILSEDCAPVTTLKALTADSMLDAADATIPS